MYLSRIALDVGHPSVRQALNNCHDMHRNLMCAFPMPDNLDQARKDMGLLYKLVIRREEIHLLVMSTERPDEAILNRNGGRLEDNSPKDISALRGKFRSGMELRFELLAAPCKKVGGDGKNSRRVFLKTEEERRDWLERQGLKYGFEICSVQEDAQREAVAGNKRDMAIHYDAVRFSGTLRVTDPERFWQGYSQGIGPGKAYGLGMLTVARV